VWAVKATISDSDNVPPISNMSASPSGLSNGQTPTPNGPTPNGGPPQYTRKKKAADPLRPRKPPQPYRGRPVKPNTAQPNGLFSAGRPPGQIPRNGLAPARNGQIRAPVSISGIVAEPGGWTNPPTGEYLDFPLFTTKRALREDLRYHIARFQSKKDIDPSDQEKFTRPVVLHRRDPKQPPPGKGIKDEDMTPEGPVDSKERERQEILKAEKEKQRAADLAQIAPTGNNASAMAAKKNQAFRNEKTTQVYRLDKTAEQKKASDLRYEEALPWHLEDADNKNTWVGSYEAALSDTNVIFLIDGERFLMIPVEKWYKFTAKAPFQTMTLEEVEAQMNKKYVAPRWMGDKAAEAKAQEPRGGGNRLFTVKSESNTFKNSSKRETEDMDDLDFAEDDLFQDDDEQVTMEPDNDEETKDAQERIKREQLGANVFDQANEADVDMEFVKEEKEAEEQKKLSKGVKKMLKKRERNHIYDSDSDHPYSESVCVRNHLQ
jgi:transcription initiation factor TFIIF subunit alpha